MPSSIASLSFFLLILPPPSYCAKHRPNHTAHITLGLHLITRTSRCFKYNTAYLSAHSLFFLHRRSRASCRRHFVLLPSSLGRLSRQSSRSQRNIISCRVVSCRVAASVSADACCASSFCHDYHQASAERVAAYSKHPRFCTPLMSCLLT